MLESTLSSSAVNGEEYPVQKLCEVKHSGMEQEASITDEPTCRKCLSCTCVHNNLHKGVDIPEIWKLKDVASWAELFLDQAPIGDSIQETGKSTLDCETEKEVFQKSRGKDAVDKSSNDLGSTILSSFIAIENRLEHGERHNPCALLNHNASSLPQKSSDYPQILKPEREGEDTRISSNIEGELEADGCMYSNTRKSSFHNLPIECQEDDSCIPTLDLQKKDIYFWTPANNSSSEELLRVKKSSPKLATTRNQNGKRSCGSASFFKPENLKLFSQSVLESRLPCTRKSDSSERWTPGMENLLEIKEYKCKSFIWIQNLEGSSAINSITKSIGEEAGNRNSPFTFKSEEKKGISRDEMLDFQPLKEAVDQRNEFRVDALGIDKRFEGSKYIGKDQTTGTYDRDDFNKDQKKVELRFMVKDPTVQINSFCRNLSPNRSENSTDQIASNRLNCPCESRNMDSASDLDTSPFSDETIALNSNMTPIYVENDMKENISEKVIKSIVGSQSNIEGFFNTSVKIDGHKQLFWSDQSQSDSVLAKYYFYVNYLNKLKKLQPEGGDHLPSCQEHWGVSKEKNLSAFGYCKSNSLLYEQQAKELRSNDSGTQEISCDKDTRAEVLEQHRCAEEQEAMTLFGKSSPKRLPNPALFTNGQPRKPCVFKDKKAFEAKKTGTDMAGPKRHWERASIAWSSYTHDEMKPRSQYVQTPVLGSKSRRKGGHNSLSCPSSGTESRQQQEPAIQAYDEINTDHNLLPWLLLPNELWLCIFSLLTHKDISRVSQVCRRFYQLAGDETFWKDIQLTGCHCLNDDWLVPLGNRHPKRFTLDHCRDEAQKITDMGLRQFFQHCGGSLMELSIKSCSGPGFRGDIILLHASTFCHNLTTVDVSWTGATDAGLTALVKASKSLQCLSANGCLLTDDSVITLVEKHGKSLKKLEIFGCHAITAKCLTFMAVKCPHLKVLNIGGIHKVTEDCLAEIVTSMRSLTSLNCTGLSVVRDSVIHFIVKKLPELECLVLSSCSQVTDIAVMEISSYLPTIRHLDINGCEEVTDVGVQALVGRCSKLSYIDLSSTATSKRGVCLLASFCFRTLEFVKLSFCKDISPEAVLKLCRNCKKLKILHLYGCYFLPDLESIKKINKNLEVFHDLSVPTAKFSSE
ncbi:uncharacterized protein LOC110089640 isoform X2 [Pogona vitticeps]